MYGKKDRKQSAFPQDLTIQYCALLLLDDMSCCFLFVNLYLLLICLIMPSLPHVASAISPELAERPGQLPCVFHPIYPPSLWSPSRPISRCFRFVFTWRCIFWIHGGYQMPEPLKCFFNVVIVPSFARLFNFALYSSCLPFFSISSYMLQSFCHGI